MYGRFARGCIQQLFVSGKKSYFTSMISRTMKIVIFVAFLTRLSICRFRNVTASKTEMEKNVNNPTQYPNLLLQQKEREGVRDGITIQSNLNCLTFLIRNSLKSTTSGFWWHHIWVSTNTEILCSNVALFKAFYWAFSVIFWLL